MKISKMCRTALLHAARGWKVFPITPGAKNPPLVRWGDKASSDPAIIKRWWTKWPDANIGLACGASGLAVIDLDTKDGKDGRLQLEMLELEHGLLPETLETLTPSGGSHLYFKGEIATKVGVVAPGVDTRGVGGAGGYVLAPGSSTPEGEYTWTRDTECAELPEWLSGLAGQVRKGRSKDKAPAVDLDSDAALTWAEHFLTVDANPSIQGQGGDDNAFRVACTLRDRGLSGPIALGMMVEHWNERCEPPWDVEELEVKVTNAYEYASITRPGGDTPEIDFNPEKDDATDTRFKDVFDEWVWIAKIKRFIRRKDGFRLDRQGFDSMFNQLAERGNISDAVFKAERPLRRFDITCYRPLKPEFDGACYNLWRNSTIKALSGGAPWFEEHMEYLISDETERNLVLDYLAHMVQYPDRKIRFALILQGEEGVGKTLIGEIMARIIGEQNVSRPSNEAIAEPYTVWAEAKQLVLIEELMAHGRRDTANKLKPMITNDTVSVRDLYVPRHELENYLNFLIFTNWQDSIPIDKGDRRYFVIFSDAKPHPDQTSYYGPLWARLDGDGPGHVLGYLLSRDISKFQSQGHAPMTRAKELMRRASMGDVEAHLLEAFEEREAPFDHDLVTARDLMDSLPDRLRRTNRLHNIIGTFLRKELGATCLGQIRMNSGTGIRKPVIWAVRRAPEYVGKRPSWLGSQYLTQLGLAGEEALDDCEIIPIKK